LIDLPDLQSEMKRIGRALDRGLATVVERLEAGLAGLDPRLESPPEFAGVFVYSPLEAERSPSTGHMVFKPRAVEVDRACWSCTKACTHCKGGTRASGGRGHDNPMCGDLLELAREDGYDWAVIVTTDLLLIPVVRYLQAHGRKIVHGCFPPIAMDLTDECWASIDLGPLTRGLG